MENSMTRTNIQNIEESVYKFFLYHEKTKNLQSELARIETEMFLCEQTVRALAQIDYNPFE